MRPIDLGAYPRSKRDTVADMFHGVPVENPYLWLEIDSAERTAWRKTQREFTDAYLKDSPALLRLRDHVSRFWDYERFAVSRFHGGNEFFLRNDGMQEQSVLYVKTKHAKRASVLIDPNLWSSDGTVALLDWSVSPNGKTLAYCVSFKGKSERSWRLLDVESRMPLADYVYNTPSWIADGCGFLYSANTTGKNPTIFSHRVGTDYSDDHRVSLANGAGFWEILCSDHERFVIMKSNPYCVGAPGNLWVKDRNIENSGPFQLFDGSLTRCDYLGHDGNTFFFRSEFEAKKGRVISLDLSEASELKAPVVNTVIGESEDTLVSVTKVGNRFLCHYLKDVRTVLKVFGKNGSLLRSIKLPFDGATHEIRRGRKSNSAMFVLSGITNPSRLYSLDLASGSLSQIERSTANFKSSDYEMKRMFCVSKDGTKVPLVLAHRKGLILDGSNPTILTGYGGFRHYASSPFAQNWAVWMQMGGVIAVAAIRGGIEYGEDWHSQGTLLNKQNGFDDFIAAAEHLIASGYTSAKKLAITGGSNGGLLVSACVTQRPDLFAAAIPLVGVHDMMRYHLLGIGNAWREDYGTAGDLEQFKALFAYSPLHNLRPGVSYPAMLIGTGDFDQTVNPCHSYKLAAAMQAVQAGPAPILLIERKRTGHGSGKPTNLLIEEVVVESAFLCEALNLTPVFEAL